MLPLFPKVKRPSLSKYILASQPVHYYPLNELAGTTMVDYGSTKIDGTYVGATLAQVPSPGGGKCPMFDGVNDFATMGGPPDYDLGTIMVWFRALNAATWEGAYNWIWDYNNGGGDALNFAIVPGSLGIFNYAYATTSLNWLHVAFKWNKAGNTQAHFIDGAQVDAGKCDVTIANTAGAWLASNYGVGGFVGCYLAHAAYWHRELTNTEIATIWRAGRL